MIEYVSTDLLSSYPRMFGIFVKVIDKDLWIYIYNYIKIHGTLGKQAVKLSHLQKLVAFGE